MKYLKQKTLLLAACIMLLLSFLPFQAHAASDRVVRVGFPIQGDISYIDEDGNYAGYMVDYLNKLTLFTDWEIEYVQAKGDLNTQISTLLEQLQAGQIDMMGTMNRNAALENMFLYPDYSYGSTYTVIAVRDDSSYISENYSNWDGITFATYPGMESRMQLLEHYAEVNGFTYELKNYDTYIETVNAVRNGEADAVLQVDISLPDGLRSIGRFSPTPYYFALSPMRTDLLPELNSALKITSLSYSNLQTELYQHYFLEEDLFRTSREELEYIQSLGTVRVLFFTGNAPFQYMKDGNLTGYSVEYFEDFAKSTGMHYEIIIEDDLEAATKLVEEGQVDLKACIATDSALSYKLGIRLSSPYFHSYAIRTYSKNSNCSENDITGINMNSENTLNDLESMQNSCAWLDEYSLNYYMRKKNMYDNVVSDLSDTMEFSYAVAVTDTLPQGDTMISMLNQFASSISIPERQARLSKYLLDELEYTPQQWLIANRGPIVLAIFIVVLLIVLLVFYISHKKMAYNALVNENKLLQLSSYDELTGAYNLNYFCKMLEQKIKNREPWTILAFNVHNFKYINDIYGTCRGDQLLCNIKDVLNAELNEGELLCRPGADCFYLAIPKQLSTEDINRRVKELELSLKAMAEDLLDGYRLMMYCGAISSGSAPDLTSAQISINFLIVALTYAKQLNTENVCIFDNAIRKQEQLRQYIEANMHRALEEGEYQVYLQPQMNLHTGKIESAEALVRWQTKDRGLLFPDQFIHLFEENGFCRHLDLYMVEKSCEILKHWIEEGLPPIAISINQTKSLFVSDDYLEKLLEITSRYQIDPQYIILEILEGLAFENISEFNESIERLHQAGFRVSMDDFGSEYSSLNTLGKLHIDQIKLDRMFLMDLKAEQRSTQNDVMLLIFELAKRMGVETVTEGVETKSDEALIQSMGCNYGQGYHYSKPIPANEFCNIYLRGV